MLLPNHLYLSTQESPQSPFSSCGCKLYTKYSITLYYFQWSGRTNSWLQMNRLSLRNNPFKFKTWGELLINLEECMEMPQINIVKSKDVNMWPVRLANTRISTDYAQKSSWSLITYPCCSSYWPKYLSYIYSSCAGLALFWVQENVQTPSVIQFNNLSFLNESIWIYKLRG